jgi:hypothetical protein
MMQFYKKFGGTAKGGGGAWTHPCTHCIPLSMLKTLPPKRPLPKTLLALQDPPGLPRPPSTWGQRTWEDLSNRINFTFGLLFSKVDTWFNMYLVWQVCTVTVLDIFIIFKLFSGTSFAHGGLAKLCIVNYPKDVGSRQSNFQEHLFFETSPSNSSRMGPPFWAGQPNPLFGQGYQILCLVYISQPALPRVQK